MKSAMIALALTMATPALAQVAPLDTARIASAKGLMDVIMPPAKREAMIEGIMRGMMSNVTQMMTSSPEMSAAFNGDERAVAIFDKFMTQQQERSITMLNDNFPGMMDAMTKAYARRFTTAQLGDMRSFFETPTGKVYIDQAATIMNDPDILKWQRDLMATGFSQMPRDVEAMMAEIKALKPRAKTVGKLFALAVYAMLFAPAAGAQSNPVAVASRGNSERLAAIVLPREQFLAIRVPRFDMGYAEDLKVDARIVALENTYPGITKAIAAAGSDEARKGYGAALSLLQADVATLYADKFAATELAILINFFSSETGQAMIVMSAGSSGDTASEFETDRRVKAIALIQNPSDTTKRDLTMLMESGLLPKIRAINPEIAALSARRFDDVGTIIEAALPARVEMIIKAFTEKPKT